MKRNNVIASIITLSILICGCENAVDLSIESKVDDENIINIADNTESADEDKSIDSIDKTNYEDELLDSSEGQTVSDTTKDTDSNDDYIFIQDGVAVVEKYFYVRSGNAGRFFLILENRNEYEISIKGQAIAKDSEGNLLGVEDSSLNVIGVNEQMIMAFWFDKGIVDSEENIEYSLEVSDQPYWESKLKDVSYTVTTNEDRLIIEITNNGSDDINHYMPYALFFRNGELISQEYEGYETLTPGKTIYTELECFEGEFDEYKLYIMAAT